MKSTGYFRVIDIALAPIRIIGAMVEFIWSFFVGFGGFCPGSAPLFWQNGRYTIFLKRRRSKYFVMVRDYISQEEHAAFQSELPIEQYLLRANGELVCLSQNKGGLKYFVIDLQNYHRDSPNIINYDFTAGAGYRNVLLPKTIGLLSATRMCSDVECIYQIEKITHLGHEILENQANAIQDLAVSNEEAFISFTTPNGIYINSLLTGNQHFHSESRTLIYNWDKNSNLLTFNKERKYFLLLNPLTSEQKKVELPEPLLNNSVSVASISPNGNFIAYHFYRQFCGNQNGVVVLLSLRLNNYRILTTMANVYDIRWSENEKYISVAGVKKRYLVDIRSGYKMRNAANHDKEVIDLESNTVVWSS